MNKLKNLKFISLLLCSLLIFQQTGFAQVASVELNIAGHFASLGRTLSPDKFRPLHLRSLSFDQSNNNFKLLLDKGDTKNFQDKQIRSTAQDLLDYFFVGLALPNDSFWVNLRPDAPSDIIDPLLAQTEVGKILLEADLQLKKDTAQATHPGTPEGKQYWDKLYQKAGEIYGNQNVTIPTLTRPWIVPNEIIIRESTDSAYVYKATLKVMLEQDYLKDSTTYAFKDEREKQLNEYSTQLIRKTIIPRLTQEINNAKRYAPLRQVYYSLILAQWFKARNQGKNTSYAKRINRKDLATLQAKTAYSVNTYFNAYKDNFTKGEYNVQEPRSTPYGQVIRSYFSGGANLAVPFAAVGAATVGPVIVVPVAKDPGVSNSDLVKVNVQDLSMNAVTGDASLTIELAKPTRIMLTFLANARDKSKIDNPLGIAVLGGTLKHQLKEDVRIIAAHYLIDGGVEGIIEKIKIEQPEVLGLSLGFGSLQQLSAIMKYIYSLPVTQRPIVALGNVVATYNKELFLKQYPDVFICAGQGEMAMIDLVKYCRGEIKKDEIHDVIYMNDGQVITNLRSQVFFVDMGEPMTDFLPHVVKSGGVVYMETSRGCPYNCAICSRRPFLGIGWKGRNLDNVIGDIEKAAGMGVRFINFVDEDLFAGGMERVISFAQMIREAKQSGRIPHDLIFGTSASVRSIYRMNDRPENNSEREQALKLLKEAGLAVLFVGIESGSPKQLKRYGKAASIKENEEAIKIVEKCGIWTIPGFIMLDPLVTIEEIKDNLAFLKLTGMDKRITYPLKTYIPMSGSPYTQELIDQGLVDPESYLPDRLAYEYLFNDKNVADILKRIKDWEGSQAMFFWELKIIFRSSRFGELGKDKQELVRRLIDKQTIILLDYLDEMVNLDLDGVIQEEVFQKISFKFGVRLINDMLEALQYVQDGYFPLGGEEFKDIIHRNIVREVLRLYFVQKQISIEEVIRVIFEQFHYDFNEDILKEVFALFIEEERIKQIDDKRFSLHEKFFVYKDIPWPDLPRSAKAVDGIDDSESSRQDKTTGGIDFRFLPIFTQSMDSLKVSMKAMNQSNLQRINLTQEWLGIQRLVDSGITPSVEHLKDYFVASCFRGNLDSDKEKILSCIADILRMEEESCNTTDQALKDILVVLGSSRNGEELKVAFSG